VIVSTSGDIEVLLNSQSVRRYKDRLLQHKKSLESSTLTAVEQGRETIAEDAQDAADQAVFSYQKELLFTRGTHDHGQLAMVKSALQRLKEGGFGKCAHCGAQIGAKRLEAVPWTPYCIDCQEKVERGELQNPVRAA
jgi:DnaK suppressor protein